MGGADPKEVIEMANASHRILDTETGTEYDAKAAAGRDLAHLVKGDPKDQFVWFQIARTYPERFRVWNGRAWVPLEDSSAPGGTLGPHDPPTAARSGPRPTTLPIAARKDAALKALLRTATQKATGDRSFCGEWARA